VTAEPLPPSLRDLLRERVPVVLQGYGTAEAGNLGYECERMSGLHVPDDALVQVCDLTTGAALHDGEEGQVVATVFARDYPLVRFGTGDLSAWADGDCSCGLRTPRLKGWLGRVGDAVKVRGMFLHPRQIAALMAAVPAVAAYRFVIDRAEHRDTLRCELVAGDGADPDALTAEVRERARSMLRFAVDVAAVAAVEGGPLVDRRTWD
jgi:phenylacetate-CoA ligase